MKYFKFEGLAKRQEYWAVTLLTFIVSWIPLVIALLLSGGVAILSPMTGGLLMVLIILAWLIACIWLLLAVAIKRCNDADIHVLWVLLFFIPVINFWWWIILGVLPSVDKNFIPNEKT